MNHKTSVERRTTTKIHLKHPEENVALNFYMFVFQCGNTNMGGNGYRLLLLLVPSNKLNGKSRCYLI